MPLCLLSLFFSFARCQGQGFRDPTVFPTKKPTLSPSKAPSRSPTLHDCNLYYDTKCYPNEYSSQCSSCCEEPAAICNNYETVRAQCSNNWAYVGQLDWVIIQNQGSDTMRANTDCLFSSNRLYVMEVSPYSDGEYMNTMIFTDTKTDTQISWNCPEYEPLYLTYPTTYVSDLCPDPCEGTPCPTSCPNGYTPSEQWENDGCVVYCMDRPTNGQCLPGGSGCTSSCVSSQSNTSSDESEMSTTAIVATVIGGGAFIIIASLVIFLVIRRLSSNIPLKDRENELEKQEQQS